MTTHILEFEPSRYSIGADVRPYDVDTWRATVEVSVANRYQSSGGRRVRHTLHFTGADNCHRDTQGGPVYQHAHAYLVPQATMIADSPIRQAPVIDAEIGDLIVFAAHDTVLRIVDGGRWADTRVEIVTTSAPTVDHTEWAELTNARA